MKYAAFLWVMLLTAAGFTLLTGRRALALNRVPEEGTTATSKFAAAVSNFYEPQLALRTADSVAGQQTEQPMGEASKQNQFVSISEIILRLDASFSQQQLDYQRSHTAEQQLRELFLPLTNKDTNFVSVQCRTTLCRVGFSHVTEAAFQKFFSTIKTRGLSSGWNGQVAGGRVATNEDGKVSSVFYLAKAGTTLPLGPPVAQGTGDGKDSSKPAAKEPQMTFAGSIQASTKAMTCMPHCHRDAGGDSRPT
jgi:hypothetical protein